MISYELWDLPSRNVVGSYTDKQQALAFVRQAVALHGTAFAEAYLLGQEDSAGRVRLIAEGRDLVAMALAAGPIGERAEKSA